MNRVFLILKEEFLTGIRNRWLLIYTFSYLLLAMTISPFSLAGLNILGMKAVGKILSSLINLSLYLIPLISLIISSISIVGDRETNYMEWLMSNPITEWEYLVGKYLGIVSSISFSTLTGFGLASWFVILFLPPEDVSKYLMLIGISLIASLVYIAVGLAISIYSGSRYQALGTSFFIWFFFIFIFDLIMMSFILSYVKSVFLSSLIAVSNPIEAIRLYMIYVIDPELTFLGFTGIGVVRENIDILLLAATATLAAYTAFFTYLGYRRLRRQDLI